MQTLLFLGFASLRVQYAMWQLRRELEYIRVECCKLRQLHFKTPDVLVSPPCAVPARPRDTSNLLHRRRTHVLQALYSPGSGLRQDHAEYQTNRKRSSRQGSSHCPASASDEDAVAGRTGAVGSRCQT